MTINSLRLAIAAALSLLALLSLQSAAPVAAQTACRFGGGFALLRDQIGTATAGDCVEDEHPATLPDAPGGALVQRTTRGVFVWRPTDNWTAFADDNTTWINRGDRIFQRPNGDRFWWETGAEASGLPLRYPGLVSIPETPQHPAYTLYVPDVAVPRGAALDAVLVLHGVDADGPSIAAAALPWAQARGLAVIAPTIAYGNWRDPMVIRDEELRIPNRLASLLAAVRDETHVPVAGRPLVFGFSRGGQTASRFTMFYPALVRAVASCSAGTYTMPLAAVTMAEGRQAPAPLPFGIADVPERAGRPIDLAAVAAVPWLVGVGANDNRDGDVPRQWDQFEGANRVQRAQRFAAALTQIGASVQVAILPNTGHEITSAMLDRVFAFFDQAPPA
jgi:poly(3-hydroxybutyrate) depolymerase